MILNKVLLYKTDNINGTNGLLSAQFMYSRRYLRQCNVQCMFSTFYIFCHIFTNPLRSCHGPQFWKPCSLLIAVVHYQAKRFSII